MEVKASFDLDYPTMGRVSDVLAAIARCGFPLVGHFTLPDEAWWDDFYIPMQRRIAELPLTPMEGAICTALTETLSGSGRLPSQQACFLKS